MSALVPPLPGLVLLSVPDIDQDPDYTTPRETVPADRIEDATVITSTVDAIGEPRHKVVLDIDLPAKLIPSTTPGHFHLYIDHEIPWPVYSELLDVLAKAGLIEPGYRSASQARGYTAARLPWVKKGATKQS